MFKLTLDSNDYSVPLMVSIALDNQIVLAPSKLDCARVIEINFPDEDESSHELLIAMQGKTWNHTKIDPSGEINEDALLDINTVEFDDIDFTQVFYEKSLYRHSFNSDSEPVDQKFFRYMGCNGEIRFVFTTPFYLWLLENM